MASESSQSVGNRQMLSSRIRRVGKRNVLATRKFAWRLFNNYAPDAKAAYILGAQRSGTTLLIDCLEKSLECEVLGESSRAMVDYRIRSDGTIREIIRSSRHRVVVFKPLTDSHRAREFLELTAGAVAIWAFRRVEDRANSSVAKFGDHNLQVLRDLSVGKGLDRWQAQGLTDRDFAFIRQFDYSEMAPETASAIFWYLRNSLFFNLSLEHEARVLPLAYEDLVSRPGPVMRGVCRFIGARFEEFMICDIHARSVGLRESRISSEVQALCRPIYEKLHRLQQQRWAELRLDS